jgi:hypothetical protein
MALAGTRRRPPRRTLGRSPRCIRRQTVERETPRVRPASSTVTIAPATCRSYHSRLTVSIVSYERTEIRRTRGRAAPKCGRRLWLASRSLSVRKAGVHLRVALRATAPADSLRRGRERGLVSLAFASWNQICQWLSLVQGSSLRGVSRLSLPRSRSGNRAMGAQRLNQPIRPHREPLLAVLRHYTETVRGQQASLWTCG